MFLCRRLWLMLLSEKARSAMVMPFSMLEALARRGRWPGSKLR